MLTTKLKAKHNSGFISNLSPTTAHTILIQILEEDYLYERLYEGLKMEGASNLLNSISLNLNSVKGVLVKTAVSPN